VQHRSRVAIDPSQPNLRQVHLIGSELFQDVATQGHTVGPGELGENITTCGIDLLLLPTGATLRLGTECLLSITGLRSPCRQIDTFQDGLLSAVLDRTDEGRLIKKTGVMAVVILGGIVRPGDIVEISLPPRPHVPLTGV
jgi:MOSC domain-containing protein YiiM